MRSLIHAGPFFKEELPPTALLYPNNVDRRMREEFVHSVEQELSVYAGSTSRNSPNKYRMLPIRMATTCG